MTQWFFLRGQNQFMSDRGFEVHATSSAGPYLDQLVQRDPIVAHPVFISRSIRPWQDLGSLARLTVLLLRVRPDIVQVSTSKAALLGSLAAWLTRVPVRIYQIRGLSSESEIGWRRLLFRQLERWTATMCNGHFVNAASLRHHAVRAGILSPHQGFIAGFGMSNGVDVDRFSPTNVMPADLSLYSKPTAERDYTPQDPVIGFVGRITADKGIEDLYAAWQVIRAEFPRSRLLLVGPWEHESAVRNGCRSALEQDPRVVCPGTQLDVAPFYRVMHVLAFPTHGTEGFPNAPMEAAAMGLPVVATRVIGCVDAVVDNVTGKLIEPRQAAQLIQALRDYLSNPELQRQHGTAARERVHAEFRPERLWQEFLGEYCRLLRQAGLPVPTANPTSDMQTRESQSSRQSHAA